MSDKTFSEECGQPAFDWRKALEHPELHNHHDLNNKAKAWVCCAVGNQCAIIPRGFAGAPLDPKLCILGLDFTDYVDAGHWEDAIQTLNEIEARSAILIAEELAKRNATAYAEHAQEQSE